MASGKIKRRKIYGFWPGLKYVVILSVLLFWFPPFGQIVAGYVGGRKAGTPLKGLFAALIPVCAVLFLLGLSSMGFMTGMGELLHNGATFGLGLLSGLPLIGTIADFSLHYLAYFYTSLGAGSAWLGPYALTVVFGYVGGVLSLQHQKELKEHEYAGQIAVGPVGPAPVPVPAAAVVPASKEGQIIGMDGDIPIVMGKKPGN